MEGWRGRLDRAAPWAATLVLVLMGVLAGGAALRESMTVDEPAHLGAGVSYIQRLDMRMNVEHPPLGKVLAGLPLVVRGVRVDYDSYIWRFADGPFTAYLAQWPFGHWVITRWNDPEATLASARLPMLLLTLGLGALLYVYGSRLGGRAGGLLCLCLYASTPLFLAFGPLVLTDVPVTFFVVLTVWSFAAMWRSDGGGRTVFRFAAALAGALLSKFSAGILLFAFGAFQLGLRWMPPAGVTAHEEEARAWRRRGWRNTLAGVSWAALVVYGVYFLFSFRQPTTALAFLGDSAPSIVLRRLLMPAWTFLLGLGLFLMTSVRPTFVLEHAYSHGVWFYFPLLFALKTPLAALGVFALGIPVAFAARRGRRPDGPIVPIGRQLHWRATWVFLVVFVAFCLLSQLDISIRHFSVPMALLILLLAPLPRAIARLRRSGTPLARPLPWLACGLVLLSLATAIRAYPNYIPFLNSLSMGREGFTLVNDSNLDWCQSFPEVRRFAEERHLANVLLDEYGFTEPTVYVPQGRLWNCQTPEPGDAGQWAVVSAGMILDGHHCPWLLRYPHEPLAGGSMYAFRLPQTIPPAGAPGGPPRPDEFRNWAGMPGPTDFRLVSLQIVRDPQQMKPVLERMWREFEEQRRKQRAAGR
ncbi:MAG TPA: glycosyltransferase family 39 protein [Vicinamibacteria bacterium]|nr:glycosyltransferase family 39 protein [Vicinamibacteria bacterium]